MEALESTFLSFPRINWEISTARSIIFEIYYVITINID